MNLSCYIVDDEPHAIDVLRDYINRTPGLELLGCATDPLLALPEISVARPPDITFVDVDMPAINGLEFAALIRGISTVIFTTAYREYAVEAFEREAADYLVKPLFYERFLASVQRYRKSHVAAMPLSAPDFFVRTGTRGKLIRVRVADVHYIEGADAYIHIQLADRKITTYMTLAEVLKYLPAETFTRIHKSFIVRDALVEVIEPGQVKLTDRTCLPIGPAYRAAFQRKFGSS